MTNLDARIDSVKWTEATAWGTLPQKDRSVIIGLSLAAAFFPLGLGLMTWSMGGFIFGIGLLGALLAICASLVRE